MVYRVFHFSRAINGLKKCEKITKNAKFNKDFLGDFIFNAMRYNYNNITNYIILIIYDCLIIVTYCVIKKTRLTGCFAFLPNEIWPQNNL